ncbi:MAG: RelA/SpoT family protein [Anaerolineae bacterium]
MSTTQTPIEFEKWLASITNGHPRADLEFIQRAYDLASQAHIGQKRSSGEPYIQHCLAVADMLASLRLDSETLAAALLHDVPEDTEITIEEVQDQFGPIVACLVDGVTKLTQIEDLNHRGQKASKEEARAESLRKMFLAMLDDVRVAMIKLADRLHNMRTLDSLPEHKQRRIARETLDIYAPLADSLGIRQFKLELEDLSLRYLEPGVYTEIVNCLDEHRPNREKNVVQVHQSLQQALSEFGLQAQVFARPNHIYNIYREMKLRDGEHDQIYDLVDIRIIVDDWLECYKLIGIVHSLWRPIPGEFDDYIASPKGNMYRSLHTDVVGPNGLPLAIKVRTEEMHALAELGIAAHWLYKTSGQTDPDFDAKMAWLHQLTEWREEVTTAQEFVDSLKSDVFEERVDILTPKGDVVDLPQGATPVDFAYRIHTEVGHRCRGARVNGRLVSLDYQLGNGDQVEILTAKRGGPNRDWLNPYMGYAKTGRARSKIRHWFRHLDRDEAIEQGRSQLNRELKRLALDGIDPVQLASFFGLEGGDDFLYAVGVGDITGHQILENLAGQESSQDRELALPPSRPSSPSNVPVGVRVSGVGKPPTRLARCCKPAPGDPIVGYITRQRKVTVHRQDCPNVFNPPNPSHLIEANWTAVTDTYPVKIVVEAYDRPGLLRDIAGVAANELINLSAASVDTRTQDHTAIIVITLELTDLDQLSRVLSRIEQLPNVVEVRRDADPATT